MKVLRKSSDVQLTALQIAQKTEKVERATASMVNPILYKLEKKREVKKVQTIKDKKPKWMFVTNSDGKHLQISSQASSNTGNHAQLPPTLTEEFIELKTPLRELSCGLLEASSLLIGCAATHRDWKQFAFKVGFQGQDVTRFECTKDPPYTMISNWWPKQEATVQRFIEILHKMERADVISALKKAFEGKMSPSLLNHIDQVLGETEATCDNNETEAISSLSE